MKKILFITLLIFAHCQIKVNPYKEGEYAYNKHCSGCHGDRGEGLNKLYPDLKDTNYIFANRQSLFCLLTQGITNESKSNFKPRFGTQEMPANPLLTPSDVSNILNYINSILWHQKEFSIIEIKQQLNNCAVK